MPGSQRAWGADSWRHVQSRDCSPRVRAMSPSSDTELLWITTIDPAGLLWVQASMMPDIYGALEPLALVALIHNVRPLRRREPLRIPQLQGRWRGPPRAAECQVDVGGDRVVGVE